MANIDTLASSYQDASTPTIRKINWFDIKEALAEGLDDFKEMPTHAIFLIAIYPVIGLFIGYAVLGGRLTPLLFPLAAGFALIGPIAAIGLYELSRRREERLPLSWKHAFDVFRSRSIVAIAELSLVLIVLFLGWLVAAQAIYMSTLGVEIDVVPASFMEFMRQALTTPAGWTMIIVGNLVGLLFAIVALAISVVSFPLLVDRDVSMPTAIQTSIKAVLANPKMMAIWGVIVAVALAAGSLPLFIGLAVVLPVLGHATWHLYRKLVI